MSSNSIVPVALTLRDAGFAPLPRLFLRRGDIPRIQSITLRYTGRCADKINDIRHQVQELPATTKVAFRASGNPVLDRNAAWEAFERGRGGLS